MSGNENDDSKEQIEEAIDSESNAVELEIENIVDEEVLDEILEESKELDETEISIGNTSEKDNNFIGYFLLAFKWVTGIFAILAIVFGITSIPDLMKYYNKNFVKKELRIFSVNESTEAEDENIVLYIDEKDKDCVTTKTKEDNRLILVVRCKGLEGDTINFTATSKDCPETRYLGYGDLGHTSGFRLKCN